MIRDRRALDATHKPITKPPEANTMESRIKTPRVDSVPDCSIMRLNLSVHRMLKSIRLSQGSLPFQVLDFVNLVCIEKIIGNGDIEGPELVCKFRPVAPGPKPSFNLPLFIQT